MSNRWDEITAAMMQPSRQAIAVIAATLAGWAWVVDPTVKLLGLIGALLLVVIQWQTLRSKRLELEKLELEIALLREDAK